MTHVRVIVQGLIEHADTEVRQAEILVNLKQAGVGNFVELLAAGFPSDD